jgi:hypothetical protein
MPDQSQSPPPSSHPAFQQPPASAGQPVTIPVTLEEFNRLRSYEPQLAELRAEKQREADARAAAEALATAKAGEYEKALQQQRDHLEAKIKAEEKQRIEFERQVFTERRSSTLSGAMAGREFVSEYAAAQLRELLTEQFETQRDASGNLVVREKVSGRPAADALKELLDAPSYAHFFKSTGRGGAGTDGARPTSGSATNTDQTDAFMANWRSGQEQMKKGIYNPIQG